MSGTRPTGRGDEIVEVGPARCRNGHQLIVPNVQVRGSADSIAWICRTCGDGHHRSLSGVEWFTAEAAPF